MRRLTVFVLLVLAVTVSLSADIEYDFSYKNDSMVKDFGLGIGETGYLSIHFVGDLGVSIPGSDYSGAYDYVLTFTVSGPTGFEFKLTEPQAVGVSSTSSRIHVGTTADTVSAVATEIIASEIEDSIVNAAMKLIGYAIPYYNVASALKTAYDIYSKLESGVEFDLVTIVVYPAHAELYNFRIDNPTFHPWSKNTLLMTKEPID